MPSLLRSTLTYAPGVLVRRAIAYLIVIIFTRLLAPAEFGLYSLVITYGELLDSVFMNWSRLGMLRFLRKHDSADEGGLVKANLYIYAINIMAGLLGAALLSLSVGDSTSSLQFFFALTVYLIGNSAMRFSLTILRVLEKQKLYTVLEIVRPTLSFAGIFLVIPFLGLSYGSLAFGFFAVTALFGIGSLIWTTKKYQSSSANWMFMQQMMRYALPLVMTFFLGAIVKATDRYMLNLFSGAAMVGIYAASYSLSRPPFELLFNTINLGTYPKLVSLYENESEQSAAQYLEHLVRIQIYWGFPMVVGIATLAEPFANIMLGEEYRHAATILMPLMALTGLCAGLKAFAFDQVFHLKQRPMILNYTLLAAAMLNVVLNYFFILSFGAYGVAWATLLSYFLALMLSIILSIRLFPLSFSIKEAGIAFVSSLVMWWGLSLIRSAMQEQIILQVCVGIPLGVVCYFIVSLVLGSHITKNILKRMRMN